jgi:malate synthase
VADKIEGVTLEFTDDVMGSITDDVIGLMRGEVTMGIMKETVLVGVTGS